jgi:UDP-glucose 4-epimerase
MNKNCIIYGGAGFIGSHITDELLNKGYRITVFDKINSSRKNLEHILDKIEFIEGDFNNEVDIENSIKNKNYVIHLVSSTLPADSNLNPFYDVESNLKSSLHLFEECAKNEVSRVIFISSGGTIYGNPVKLPINEKHQTNPITSYGIIKLTIEKYLALFKNMKGLNYKILRFSNPFGERQNPIHGQGLITTLLYKIKKKKSIEIWGNGTVIRDYFYIGDGAKAIHNSIIDKSTNNIYNISSGEGLSINQILDKFRRVLKLDFEVKYKAERKFDVKKNVLDNRLAWKFLKWRPETEFNTALMKTWRYIIDNE